MLSTRTHSKTRMQCRAPGKSFPRRFKFLTTAVPLLHLKTSRQSQCSAFQHKTHLDSSQHGSSSPISAEHPPHPSTEMKVIGIGARGISAMKRLQSVHGDAELWAIDSDPRLLSSCRGISQIEVQPSDDSVLSPQDLASLCTPASGPSQEALGSSHNGVAFVLGSSLGSPGGSSLVGLSSPLIINSTPLITPHPLPHRSCKQSATSHPTAYSSVWP